jgi:hypothetical protein
MASVIDEAVIISGVFEGSCVVWRGFFYYASHPPTLALSPINLEY